MDAAYGSKQPQTAGSVQHLAGSWSTAAKLHAKSPSLQHTSCLSVRNQHPIPLGPTTYDINKVAGPDGGSPPVEHVWATLNDELHWRPDSGVNGATAGAGERESDR